MASNRIGRTTEDIRRELTAIFRELKDPRVKDVMLSIVRVELTNDLSYCKVYVSAMEGQEKTREAVKGLKSAAGYIRKEVSTRLKIRHTPQLIFVETDSIVYSANISKMLQDLDREKVGFEVDTTETNDESDK